MSEEGNRYIEAARSDVEKLRQEFEDVRQRIVQQAEAERSSSELVETAWGDLQQQWQRLEAARDRASVELRNSYEEARQRLRRVLDSYRDGAG